MEISPFFTAEDSDCSWYWNTQKLDEIKNLFNSYDTIIERLNRYKSSQVSFAFVAPPDNKNTDLLNYKLLTNKMSNKLDKKSTVSSNKLSIDLITGKYIDLSIKRPQRPSTVINTSDKFEEVIEENNKMKAMLKNHK